MQNLIPLIFIGFFIYLIFSRKGGMGGMGCCGGHGGHGGHEDQDNHDSHSSDKEIKRNYRQMAHEHHPDKAIAEGLPEELIKYANDRFRQIQEAYEEICRIRSIS